MTGDAAVLELDMRAAPATLQRVATVLAHQRLALRSLAVTGGDGGHWRVTAEVADPGAHALEQVRRRLERLPGVLEATATAAGAGCCVHLLAVDCAPVDRDRLLEATAACGARLVDERAGALTLAVLGADEDLERVLAALPPSASVRHDARLPLAGARPAPLATPTPSA